MTTHWIGSLVICICAMVGSTAAADDDPLASRAADITKLFRSDPGSYENLFNKTFLAAVPQQQITALFADFFKRLGPCSSAKLTERIGLLSGKFDLIFDSGFSVPATITVESDSPHLISGLLLRAESRLAASLDDVVKELHTQPGAISFQISQLDKPAAPPLAGINPDQSLAIGSAFKLYILAELIRSIEAGERHWTDVVTLDANLKSLPSGELQNWPAGAPLTLHTLASFMISKSDNTAADQLLGILGRERVEQMLSVTGNRSPQRSIPFLYTSELFKLKSNSALADRYLSGELSVRRDVLKNEVSAAKLGLPPSTGPNRIDSLEWFASADDLCRLMSWIRDHTASGDATAARGILAINPGLDISKTQFPYIGFKGGSEPGVLNLTFLLHSGGDSWYALAVTWNNPAESLDERKFLAQIQAVFRLLK